MICTRKNRVVKGFGPRAEMLRWQEKNPEEFEDTYHQRSIVESVFSSFKCRFTASCSRKETGNAKTAAAPPQVRLLQPGCHSETTQETRVVCLACAVLSCNVLAQDILHHIMPRENSVICGKSKATKCR